MNIVATVIDGEIRLPAGVELAEGARVEIVTDSPDSPRPFAERYAQYIGIVKDAPPDLAANHDHYLYGAPRSTL